MKYLINLVRTDLIQARILSESDTIHFLKFSFLFLRSRTCRIHTFLRLRPSNKLISFISKWYLDKFFIDIGKQTEIDKYFFLPHPKGIIIANNVKIGSHVHIGQYVTLGGSFKKSKKLQNGDIQKLPIIGNRVMIHPGAVIGGPVTIGNDVIIGANAVVTRDVPSNSIVFGQNQLAKKKIVIPETGGEFQVI
tara:strand:+ start:258 stop:833 length:576 start_codon:yes stop_codon:yes gene_type:complete